MLGCTHYPFVANVVSQIVGRDVPIFDGNKGIAKECKRRLEALSLLNLQSALGKVEITGNQIDDKKIKIAEKLMENK